MDYSGDEEAPAPDIVIDDDEADAPNPIVVGANGAFELDPDLVLRFEGTPEELERRYAAMDDIEPLGETLAATGMPFALLNMSKPSETTLMTSEQYRSSEVSVMFCYVMDAVIRSWQLGTLHQRTAVAAMIMVGANGAHAMRPKKGGGRKGTASKELKDRCTSYVARNKAFIIFLDAVDDAAICTWCSPNADLDRFDWLFLHALCKSFAGVQQSERQKLDKERILIEFGLARAANERCVNSLFNELQQL